MYYFETLKKTQKKIKLYNSRITLISSFRFYISTKPHQTFLNSFKCHHKYE